MSEILAGLNTHKFGFEGRSASIENLNKINSLIELSIERGDIESAVLLGLIYGDLFFRTRITTSGFLSKSDLSDLLDHDLYAKAEEF